MYYPNCPYCPGNGGENTNDRQRYNHNNHNSKESMMRQIQQTEFAAYDLQLYLDTHPDCTEALELFSKLNATARSLRQDFENAYGPLRAVNSPCDTPFAWNELNYAWPWAKEWEV